MAAIQHLHMEAMRRRLMAMDLTIPQLTVLTWQLMRRVQAGLLLLLLLAAPHPTDW